VANTRIQIKRSQNNQTPPALWTGELCYTQNGSGAGGVSNSGLLYIGRPSDNTAIAIGGVLTMGVTSPNQIISTNSTSYIDRILATNGNFNVINVPGQGNGQVGQVLTSNGTSNLYWSSPGGGGTVTQVFAGNGTATNPNPITGTGNVFVVANSGIVANATGTFVNAAPASLYFISGAVADYSMHFLYGGL